MHSKKLSRIGMIIVIAAASLLVPHSILGDGPPGGWPKQCAINLTFPNHGVPGNSTRNPELDRAINEEVANLNRVFGVKPNVLLLNDQGQPNAYASSQQTREDHTGTVYIGLTLIAEQIEDEEKGEIGLAGIIAHEFGHITQIRRRTQLRGKFMELHADFLAGWFLGKKNRVKPIKIEGFAKSLFEKGDFNFWHPLHHGTPNERVNAMMIGYASHEMSLDEAYVYGERLVTNQQVSARRLRAAFLQETRTVYPKRFEDLSDTDVDRVAGNIRSLARQHMDPKHWLIARHVASTWGDNASKKHLDRCPICTKFARAIAEGTALSD